MQRDRRPADPAERLVFFTDAVVAISMTLLVLPLVDLVPGAERENPRVSAALLAHLPELGAFALSFAVIFRFWWAHHRLFRHVSLLSRRIVAWNVVWLFSIVFLPVPTAIITAYSPSAGTVALYTGTLVVTSGSLTMLAWSAYRNPAVSVDRQPETREEVLGNGTAFAFQLVALVLGVVFPHEVNYKALLLMLLSGPVEALVKRHWAAHPAGASTRRRRQS